MARRSGFFALFIWKRNEWDCSNKMGREKDMEEKRYRIIGTAGHIDHGKTWLVKALTGTDTDRLAEEKRRGITIENGFAFLKFPDAGKPGLLMCQAMKGL